MRSSINSTELTPLQSPELTPLQSPKQSEQHKFIAFIKAFIEYTAIISYIIDATILILANIDLCMNEDLYMIVCYNVNWGLSLCIAILAITSIALHSIVALSRQNATAYHIFLAVLTFIGCAGFMVHLFFNIPSLACCLHIISIIITPCTDALLIQKICGAPRN